MNQVRDSSPLGLHRAVTLEIEPCQAGQRTLPGFRRLMDSDIAGDTYRYRWPLVSDGVNRLWSDRAQVPVPVILCVIRDAPNPNVRAPLRFFIPHHTTSNFYRKPKMRLGASLRKIVNALSFGLPGFVLTPPPLFAKSQACVCVKSGIRSQHTRRTK